MVLVAIWDGKWERGISHSSPGAWFVLTALGKESTAITVSLWWRRDGVGVNCMVPVC